MSTLIPLAHRPVTPERPAPGPCPACGAHAWHKPGSRDRHIQDRDRTPVAVPRDRGQNCRRTITVKPEGMDGTDRSRPLQALIGVWYSLGLSRRSLSWRRSWCGYPVSHVTCGRDIPRLGAAVCPQGPASAVYRDETYIQVRGRPRPVAAVRGLQGDRLRLPVWDEGWDGAAWRAPLGDGGVAVGVTADAPADGPPLAHLGLRRPPCRVHRRRTFHRAVRRMAPVRRQRSADRRKAMVHRRQTLPADGETPWRLWREEAVAAGEPHRGPRGAWRRLVRHMWERGKAMTVHRRRSGVPPDTHRREGRFGRIKPRYRSMRGFHSLAGAQHARALLADVLA